MALIAPQQSMVFLCDSSHSGENQAEVIKEVIREYNLQNRIGYFVTDNAANNNTAIDMLVASSFGGKEVQLASCTTS